MRLSNQLLIGLIVFCFCGMSGLLIPTESQAVQSGQPDENLNKHCKEVPPWRGVIPGDKRFVPTFVDDAGVAHAYCDRQTGLVLEQSTSTDSFTWFLALEHCANRTVGGTGQKGWRLLSMPELASLVDLTSSTCGDPISGCLSDGHPFQLGPENYWSATTVAVLNDLAWSVSFFDGQVRRLGKGATRHAWCVRGAMAADVY